MYGKHNNKNMDGFNPSIMQSKIDELRKLDEMHHTMEEAINEANTQVNSSVESRVYTLKNINEELLANLTRQKWKDELLRINEERYKAVFESVSSMLVISDGKGIINYVNKAFEQRIGYTKEELVGQSVGVLHPTEEKTIVSTKFRAQLGEKALRNVELTYITKSGECLSCLIHQTSMNGLSGEKLVAWAIRDISGLKGVENAFLHGREKFNKLPYGKESWIWETDKDWKYTYVSTKVSKILGYQASEIVGTSLFDLMSSEERVRVKELMALAAKKKVPVVGNENIKIHHDGHTVMLETNCVPLISPRGNVKGYVGVDSSIAPKGAMEYGSHDPLTGLSTRILLGEHFKRELSSSRRNGKKLAVIFLDLDRFKDINDTFGHDMGDKVLQGVSDRLKKVLRGCDTISRFGGDEFVLLLPQIDSPEDAAKLASKVIDSIKQPFQFEQNELYVTTSVGVAIYPDDSIDAQALLKYADIAMFRAKEDGRNTYKLYTSSMNIKAIERMQLENSMHKALDRKEFSLYYQPLVDLNNGSVVAIEALLRWEHPDLGLLLPKNFIKVAEKTGLIVSIGEWVIREACKKSKELQDLGHAPVKVSVNLSKRQLHQSELVDMTSSILQEVGLDAECLVYEFTEDSIMEHASICNLKQLGDIGVKLSIDDFGTGYSSLSRLRNLPVDNIKIDRSFIQNVVKEDSERTIVKALVSIAHNLGLSVVAEGVETLGQLKFLKTLKCNEIQGYLFSPPVPERDINEKCAVWFKGQ